MCSFKGNFFYATYNSSNYYFIYNSTGSCNSVIYLSLKLPQKLSISDGIIIFNCYCI